MTDFNSVAANADREFIKHFVALFKEKTGNLIQYADTNKRRIMLDNMTDEDAALVAREFERMERGERGPK